MKDDIPFTPAIVKRAYAIGAFPMPSPDRQGINWYMPDPRAIIPLTEFHVSKSLRRELNKSRMQVTIDQAFRNVMLGCADRPETWITDEFIDVYCALHREGVGHSVEVWQGNELVGGVYGVALGGAFFAESMFHRASNASKVALYYLVQHMLKQGMDLLEVQFLTPHLASLGAIEIPLHRYEQLLGKAIRSSVRF